MFLNFIKEENKHSMIGLSSKYEYSCAGNVLHQSSCQGVYETSCSLKCGHCNQIVVSISRRGKPQVPIYTIPGRLASCRLVQLPCTLCLQTFGGMLAKSSHISEHVLSTSTRPLNCV